jgi:hypothetical protein
MPHNLKGINMDNIIIDTNEDYLQDAVQQLILEHTKSWVNKKGVKQYARPNQIILNCWAMWDNDYCDPELVAEQEIPFSIMSGGIALSDDVDRSIGFQGVDEFCYKCEDRHLDRSVEAPDRLAFIIEFNYKDKRDKSEFDLDKRVLFDTEIHVLNKNKYVVEVIK